MARAAGAPALRDFLTWRLHRVNKLTDKATSDAYAQAFGLPVGEARCLAAIGDAAPLSVNALAAAANVDKGHASRAVQALVERGLVSKLGSTADARSVVLAPTAAGLRLWKRVMGMIASRNDEIFACLSRAEQRELAALLDRVIAQAQA